MPPETFRKQLSALLQGAAESGLDVFWLTNELAVASMALVYDCRCDLAEVDEEPAPY
jgi:hypothetical protein